MAGIQRFDASLAAGAAIPNLLAGTFMERLQQRPELMTVYGVVDDVAALAGLITCEIRVGNVIVLDRGIVPLYTARQGPDRDKHLIGRAVGAPFDLMQVRLFNGTAATAAPYRFLIESTPL
jgi:hypothetical protein